MEASMVDLLKAARQREKEMVRLLGEFVRCESPSQDKAALDRFGHIVTKEWRGAGAQVHVLRQKHTGDHVRAEIWLGSGRPSGQILVLGHLDTVYPLGTIAKVPFRLAGGRAWGPGTYDMKGGIVQALAAVDALRAVRARPRRRLVFLWTSDEEIGGETSHSAVEHEARKSDAALVLEPSFGTEGRLKTQRKGVGGAEILVTGRSAHAGVDPERGVNAVHELALQIARLMKMNEPQRGITVQTTIVSGGTASNVVPSAARAEVDIRFSRPEDGRRIERALQGLRPALPGARIKILGNMNRPPLERTSAVAKLFHQAQQLMREVGLPLGEASTGGGSDGNFTAALGVPTLDGLGPVGNDAHSPNEHVLVRALPERAALLAGLLATL